MLTKTKKMLSGFVAAGALFAMVGTANASRYSVDGKVVSVPSYDYNTASTTDPTYSYFSIDRVIGSVKYRYFGYTTDDKLSMGLIAAKVSNTPVSVNSNNCGSTFYSSGMYFVPMGQIRYVVNY